ncbi:PREDICTED: cyclic nucleotide-gated ion channel 1-like [Fragaria vesca subsp. vesca]
MVWHSYIIIDILAILPFPQVLIFIFFSKMRSSRSFNANKFIMNFFLLVQYVPRVFRIYLSCKEPKRSADGESTAIWVKGLLNLFMYILASNVLGAVWYCFAIQRMLVCWQHACQIVNGCDISTFSCHEHHSFTNITFLNSLCPIDTPDSKLFDFGIFLGILQSGIPKSTNSLLKLTNCFCWGLRNLSSLGSNLQPSTNIWENIFVVFTSVIGLLLFIYLIGNLQTYMQLETATKESHRHERNKKRKRDLIGQEIELWLSKSLVPMRSRDNIKSQILERVQEELDDNRNISGLDYILSTLPLPLRMYIKDCSPLNRLKKVPVLQDMDEEGLKAICEHLEPMKYTDDIIIEEGEPLQLMLIIVEGVVKIEKSICFSNLQRGAGELCGEELLSWPALISFPDIPSATESAKAIGDVEALVLMASDMESVGSKFSRHFQEYSNSRGRLHIHLQNVGAAIFTEKDLKNATNNYHVSRVLGEGGSATVYKGIQLDNSVVAVKKIKSLLGTLGVNLVTTEMIALGYINHKNVVRLIGCCLETKPPLLVLEGITNGSLYEHIYKTNGKGSPPLTWELRIKVAVDIARALAYLHSATPMIIHRDVNSANILIDENHTAKLIDFELARLVAEDRDPIFTLIRGTLGYMDPEYVHSNTLTAKSDVYSFGIVLMELLTSRKPVSLDRPQGERHLADIFVALVDEGRVGRILDHKVVSGGHFKTAIIVAGIAERCARFRREERPSMEEVATELEVLMGI